MKQAQLGGAVPVMDAGDIAGADPEIHLPRPRPPLPTPGIRLPCLVPTTT